MSRQHFFFFNDTATTEIYTLSLHDALPISLALGSAGYATADAGSHASCIGLEASGISPHGSSDEFPGGMPELDRKSTRLNSSHSQISYAVFCLKKKKTLPSCRRWRQPIPCA